MHSDAWPNSCAQSTIRWLRVRDCLLAWESLDTKMFLETFDVARFREKIANDTGAHGNPFLNANELRPGDAEWQRKLLFSEKNVALWILCCPEDVNARKSKRCRHNDDVLCAHCEIPVCFKCEDKWRKGQNHKIPMALGNDNLWGYTSDILVKYKVTWLEAAIVSPCWNQMIGYYVEGDSGPVNDL